LSDTILEQEKKQQACEIENAGLINKVNDMNKRLIAYEKDRNKIEALQLKFKESEAKLKTCKEQLQQEIEDKSEIRKKYDILEKKSNHIISKFTGENSLENLKTKIATLTEQIEEGKNESYKQKETIRKQDAKINELSKAHERFRQAIIRSLGSLREWIFKFRPNLTISQNSKEIKGNHLT